MNIFYDDTTDELNRKLNEYEKSGLLGIKYYNLLGSVGKFINKHGIDISTIKESIIDKINNHCRLNKACFSEPEDEISDDNEDKINDDNKDEISDNDNNNNNEENIIMKKIMKKIIKQKK